MDPLGLLVRRVRLGLLALRVARVLQDQLGLLAIPARLAPLEMPQLWQAQPAQPDPRARYLLLRGLRGLQVLKALLAQLGLLALPAQPAQQARPAQPEPKALLVQLGLLAQRDLRVQLGLRGRRELSVPLGLRGQLAQPVQQARPAQPEPRHLLRGQPGLLVRRVQRLLLVVPIRKSNTTTLARLPGLQI